MVTLLRTVAADNFVLEGSVDDNTRESVDNLDSERGCSLEENLSQDTRAFTVIVLIGGATGKNWAP